VSKPPHPRTDHVAPDDMNPSASTARARESVADQLGKIAEQRQKNDVEQALDVWQPIDLFGDRITSYGRSTITQALEDLARDRENRTQ
jgi:hypothetical protein